MTEALFFEGKQKTSLSTGWYDVFARPTPNVVLQEPAWTANMGGTATTDTMDFLNVQALLREVLRVTQKYAASPATDTPEAFDLRPLSRKQVTLQVTARKPAVFYFVSDELDEGTDTVK